MKQLMVIISLTFFICHAGAQVKIGGTPAAPAASAVLELDGGNNRGLLLPRMRKIDMLSIPAPAEGLTLYITDEQATYLRRSGNWVKLSGSEDAFALPYAKNFGFDGTIFNISNERDNTTTIKGYNYGSNTVGVEGYSSGGIGLRGRATGLPDGIGGFFSHEIGGRSLISMNKTGIGTEFPAALLHIDGSNSSGNTVIINDDVAATIQLQNAGIDKGFVQLSSNDLRLGTNAANSSGSIIMRTKGIDRVRIDSTGKMSIGAGTTSNSMLNVYGGGITIDDGGFSSLRFQDGNTSIFSLYYQNSDFINFHSPTAGYQFMVGNNSYFRLKPSGAANFTNRIGISMDNPTALLHINGFDSNVGAVLIDDYDPIIQLQNNSVNKGYIQVDGNNMVMAANISNNTGKVVLRTNDVDRLLVNTDGKIIIGSPTGTSPAGSQIVKVKGGIQATDFTVTALAAWPDYVFGDDYKLKSLEETEAFIKANKHLPNIPAAAEIEKNGMELGDMQKRTMEKIEELTLYLIEANKKINQLEQVVNTLKAKK